MLPNEFAVSSSSGALLPKAPLIGTNSIWWCLKRLLAIEESDGCFADGSSAKHTLSLFAAYARHTVFSVAIYLILVGATILMRFPVAFFGMADLHGLVLDTIEWIQFGIASFLQLIFTIILTCRLLYQLFHSLRDLITRP